MNTLILCLLLVLGSWTNPQNQEAQLSHVCSTHYESAFNRPPMDTKVIHYTGQALFLVYHHLDEEESFVTISPAKFNQHLQLLKDKHYNVISVEDYACFLEKRGTIPPNAVVITFDDGYRSFYEKAYPLLKKMGYPATNFVVVSYLDTDYPSLPFLTWQQMKEMKRDGFSFYSHTYNLHQKKAGESGSLVPMLTNRIYLTQDQRLETEEERKKRVMEDLFTADWMLKTQLGNELSMLCFPYGYYTQTNIDEAQDLGIRYFFTTKEGINSGESREIYRLNMGMPYVNADVFANKLQSYDRKK
ncbi:polysaccharide deacetylase family protein [Paenibacillus aceris]|uniref:Biofilm PGA synthesis lipoprotein PgaB n=1 Tax=Paenibacillus aceris TaxID=869555 RepID=A0ABS4I6I4_9BACL|nr:polysaccharide deacetylase family protein [Paenibacillus aceris]MBP1966523.1 biofilm PGA synthesis lipoprotein PgaB [Paenibacillus aceris]NHW39504.1 polysaccharide deacetylase family protein [Paenibacillus aceris]